LARPDVIEQFFWIDADKRRHLISTPSDFVSNLMHAVVHIVLWVSQNDLKNFFTNDEVRYRCSP
jgi:hypothetical protein